MFHIQSLDDDINEIGDIRIGVPRQGMRIRFQTKVAILDADNPIVVLGRSKNSQIALPTDAAAVSRKHAYIECQGDKFILVDQSTNGTYVQLASGERELLHHGQMLLDYEGMICLGRPVDMEDPLAIHFSRFVSAGSGLAMNQSHLEAMAHAKNEPSVPPPETHSHSTLEMIMESPLAAEMSMEECRILAGIVHKRRLMPDEYLAKEKDEARRLHGLVSGQLVVETLHQETGERVAIHTLGPGSIAGEFALLDQAVRTASLRAVGAGVEVFSIKRDDFMTFSQTFPIISNKVLRALIRSLRLTVVRLTMQQVDINQLLYKKLRGI
jgi:CRP-like cAMP-binding protein